MLEEKYDDSPTQEVIINTKRRRVGPASEGGPQAAVRAEVKMVVRRALLR